MTVAGEAPEWVTDQSVSETEHPCDCDGLCYDCEEGPWCWASQCNETRTDKLAPMDARARKEDELVRHYAKRLSRMSDEEINSLIGDLN